MGLQWTFVATVMYAEIFIVSIVLLPVLSSKTWQKLFNSRIARTIAVKTKFFLQAFIVLLLLLFAESIRASMKLSKELEDKKLGHHPEAKTALQNRMFRAHRNMYIAGFALFLNLIIRRLVTLIAKEANLMAVSEASLKQAQSATAAAQQLLDEKSSADDNNKDSATEKKDKTKENLTKDDEMLLEKELFRTQVELEKTKEELYRSNLEFESMKKQAQSSCTEYDRLLLEHEKLQHKLSTVEGDGDKKGN